MISLLALVGNVVVRIPTLHLGGPCFESKSGDLLS
jgi:hypothetical protein